MNNIHAPYLQHASIKIGGKYKLTRAKRPVNDNYIYNFEKSRNLQEYIWPDGKHHFMTLPVQDESDYSVVDSTQEFSTEG